MAKRRSRTLLDFVFTLKWLEEFNFPVPQSSESLNDFFILFLCLWGFKQYKVYCETYKDLFAKMSVRREQAGLYISSLPKEWANELHVVCSGIVGIIAKFSTRSRFRSCSNPPFFPPSRPFTIAAGGPASPPTKWSHHQVEEVCQSVQGQRKHRTQGTTLHLNTRKKWQAIRRRRRRSVSF